MISTVLNHIQTSFPDFWFGLEPDTQAPVDRVVVFDFVLAFVIMDDRFQEFRVIFQIFYWDPFYTILDELVPFRLPPTCHRQQNSHHHFIRQRFELASHIVKGKGKIVIKHAQQYLSQKFSSVQEDIHHFVHFLVVVVGLLGENLHKTIAFLLIAI